MARLNVRTAGFAHCDCEWVADTWRRNPSERLSYFDYLTEMSEIHWASSGCDGCMEIQLMLVFQIDGVFSWEIEGARAHYPSTVYVEDSLRNAVLDLHYESRPCDVF